MNGRYLFFLILCLYGWRTVCHAQTPIANRVNAKVKTLKHTDRVVAKYTDDRRHCLYYISNNRLLCYDVLDGNTKEVYFSSKGYDSIISTWLSKDGEKIFILVEYQFSGGGESIDNQAVYVLRSMTQKTELIGRGVKCTIMDNGMFYLTKFVRKETTNRGKTRYIVIDQWFYEDGRPRYEQNERIWQP